LRATYRRQRKVDPLATVEAVRSILEQLRSALPETIPKRDKDLVRMLRAAGHVNRYPATDTKRSRPSRWQREDLLLVGARLSTILERETSSHIGLSRFIDHYLRLLDFPSDVLAALSSDVNLFEASQIARLTLERLGVSAAQAKKTRSELLSTHLQAKLSGERLRLRVAEILRVSSAEAGAPAENSLEMVLEDFDPYDPTHLFWDQIKQLGFALRDIHREDVLDEEIDELLQASEPVFTILARIQKQKQRKTLKLKI
jgi:hypothetical protein